MSLANEGKYEPNRKTNWLRTKTRDMEEFVLNFVREGSITPIDIVMEITRLTYDEVKSCSEILVVA